MIDDIKNNLNEFKRNCMNHPALYDKYVGIPFFQNEEKDFLRETLGIFAKIYAHYNMINNPNALIKNYEYNQDTVRTLSAKLIDNIQSCKNSIEKHPEINGTGLCDKLVEDIQKLNDGYRPSLR